MNKALINNISIFIVLLLLFSGCAGTMKAIEYSSLETRASMSDSIMLDVRNLAKNRDIYVRVTNTSDIKEISIEQQLRTLLSLKGFNLIVNPEEAGYIIQANVLYMDYAKDASMTADGMATGGLTGAVLGSGIGSGWRANSAAGFAVGAAGAIAGGLMGKLIHVDRFLGVVDVQIQEKVDEEVKGVMTANIKQGTSTSMLTERKVDITYQEYRTRIAVEAVKTNINKEEAASVISEKLAYQISGLF